MPLRAAHGDSMLCPMCRAAVPPKVVHTRIEVPANTDGGEFVFWRDTADRHASACSWRIRTQSPSGDILELNLNAGDQVLTQPSMMSLDSCLQATMHRPEAGSSRWHVPSGPCECLVIESSSGCTLCQQTAFGRRWTRHYIDVRTNAAGSLEGLLAAELVSTRDSHCLGCQKLGAWEWYYEKARDCWVKSEDKDRPAAKSSKHLLSLPPVLVVELTRTSCTENPGFSVSHSFAPISFPVTGLNLANYFPPKCPVPSSVSALYDLRYVAELVPQGGKTEDAVECSEPPHFLVPCDTMRCRYVAHAKSLKDERWYELDVQMNGPRPLPQQEYASETRRTSRTARFLVYQRRKGAASSDAAPAPATRA